MPEQVTSKDFGDSQQQQKKKLKLKRRVLSKEKVWGQKIFTFGRFLGQDQTQTLYSFNKLV